MTEINPKIDGGQTPPTLFPPGDTKGSAEVSKQQGVQGTTFGDGVSVAPVDDPSTLKRAKHLSLLTETTPDVPVLIPSDSTVTDSKFQTAANKFKESVFVCAGVASTSAETNAVALQAAKSVVDDTSRNIAAKSFDGNQLFVKNAVNTLMNAVGASNHQAVANLYSSIGSPNGSNASHGEQVRAINEWFTSAPMSAIMAVMQEWIAMQQEAAIVNAKEAIEARNTKIELTTDLANAQIEEGNYKRTTKETEAGITLGKGIAGGITGIGTGMALSSEKELQVAGQLGKSVDSTFESGQGFYSAMRESYQAELQARQTTLQDRGRAQDNARDAAYGASQDQVNISQTAMLLAQAMKGLGEASNALMR